MTRTELNCRSTGESLTTTVVRAVAEAKGIDPLDLEECLYDVVNPEALEQLFTPIDGGSRQGAVVFRLAGCRVEVNATNHVAAELIDDGRTSPIEARS